MKKYEAPKLFVDEFVADTMIASGNAINPGDYAKNGNAGNNQYCWGCKDTFGQLDPNDMTIACLGPNTPFC